MTPPTLHVMALPHTQTVRHGYETCAYTQKVVKFCDMMSPTHKIVLYSGEHNEAVCTEHVALSTETERTEDFPSNGFDTVETPLSWEPDAPYFKRFIERAGPALQERAAPQDLLLLTTSTQIPIGDAVPWMLKCEWAVGYAGVRLPFAVFESHAWRHHVYGQLGINDGRAFDTVIPNFFDSNDFTPRVTSGDGDLLYMGRLIERKGPHVAAMLAARTGRKLLVAGPGAQEWSAGKITCTDGTVLEAPDIEYIGVLGREERAERLAAAAALLVPTLYIEPFGGVAIEAMLSGTPAVTSDWGAFTETVEEGATGARFSTLGEGAAALGRAISLDRASIRERAASRYTLPVVATQFISYFERLSTLWEEGWYA